MAYGYSEFTQFSLDVYTGTVTDVQLPPVKIDYADVDAGIYIHTLVSANAYSAISYTPLSSELTSELSSDVSSTVVNGWTYEYNYTENDFIRLALSNIKDMPDSPELTLPNGITKVYTTLKDKQINLPAIFNMDIKRLAHPWHLHEIPWIHGPTWIGDSSLHQHHWHQTATNDGHTIVLKQTIPGIIFEFDRNDRFIAVIAQPLEAPQNTIRSQYITDLLLNSINSTTNFINFKSTLDTYTELYTQRPCILVYDHICDIKRYINKVKTVTHAATAAPSLNNKDELLLKYLNSPWTTFNLTMAVGDLDQFFNVDQMAVNYVERDPRVKLQTMYVTSVANAFLVSLNTYKAIADSGDKVLVVPDELFSELKDNIVSLWLGVNSI